jgi:hypothetical protein
LIPVELLATAVLEEAGATLELDTAPMLELAGAMLLDAGATLLEVTEATLLLVAVVLDDDPPPPVQAIKVDAMATALSNLSLPRWMVVEWGACMVTLPR